MSISRSKRPKRRRAGSIELGRFVAAITTTLDRALRPSMSVSSCDTTRRSTSPFVWQQNEEEGEWGGGWGERSGGGEGARAKKRAEAKKNKKKNRPSHAWARSRQSRR